MKLRTSFTSCSKQFVLAVIFLCGASIPCAADKPWKAKPHQEWNEKDVRSVLTDSPWVRVTTLRRSWVPDPQQNLSSDPRLQGGARQMPTGGGPGGRAGGGAPAPARTDEGTLEELNVYMYWQSSRVMRAAAAHEAVLHGEKVDIEKYAAEPQNEYQIILRMEDMTPFAQHDEAFFQGNAFLLMKKGKSKISPSHVQYERNPQGAIQDAVFFFPKTGPTGAPAVSGDETDVQFSCKIADSTVRADFKPRDMADQSGPDL